MTSEQPALALTSPPTSLLPVPSPVSGSTPPLYPFFTPPSICAVPPVITGVTSELMYSNSGTFVKLTWEVHTHTHTLTHSHTHTLTLTLTHTHTHTLTLTHTHTHTHARTHYYVMFYRDLLLLIYWATMLRGTLTCPLTQNSYHPAPFALIGP